MVIYLHVQLKTYKGICHIFRDKSKIDLQGMLDVYFKSEDIEYSCEVCKAENANVKHVFTKLPR